MELNQQIIDILVHKIKDACINPKTNEPYKLDDIKIQEYKDAVQAALDTQ